MCSPENTRSLKERCSSGGGTHEALGLVPNTVQTGRKSPSTWRLKGRKTRSSKSSSAPLQAQGQPELQEILSQEKKIARAGGDGSVSKALATHTHEDLNPDPWHSHK